MIAGFGDQAGGLFEMVAGAVAARHGEMVIGEVETHAGAGGDAEDIVEVAGRAAGEEGAGKVVDLARAAEEIDSLVEMMSGFGGAGGVAAAERKMIEADGEEAPVLLPPSEGLRSPAEDLHGLALPEEQIAIAIAPEGVEGLKPGLALDLEALGFCE